MYFISKIFFIQSVLKQNDCFAIKKYNMLILITINKVPFFLIPAGNEFITCNNQSLQPEDQIKSILVRKIKILILLWE